MQKTFCKVTRRQNTWQQKKIDEYKKRIAKVESDLIFFQEKVKMKSTVEAHVLKKIRRNIKILSAQIIASSAHSDEGQASPVYCLTEMRDDNNSLSYLIRQFLRKISLSKKR